MGVDSCGDSPVADDAAVGPSGFGVSSTDSGSSGVAENWICQSQASFASRRELCCTKGWGRRMGCWLIDTLSVPMLFGRMGLVLRTASSWYSG